MGRDWFRIGRDRVPGWYLGHTFNNTGLVNYGNGPINVLDQEITFFLEYFLEDFPAFSGDFREFSTKKEKKIDENLKRN